MRNFVVALASFLLCSAGASASVTADLNGGAPATVSPGTYRYTYTVMMQSDVLSAGDYFTVYDFYGYRPGTMTGPTTWTMNDTATAGPYPNGPHAENVAVTNLQWIYAGTALSASISPVILGQFAADSSVRYTGRLLYGGFTNGNAYFFDVAGPTPEPSSALLLLGGIAGLAYLHRRRSARQKT